MPHESNKNTARTSAIVKLQLLHQVDNISTLQVLVFRNT
jgi:hypothetical protein